MEHDDNEGGEQQLAAQQAARRAARERAPCGSAVQCFNTGFLGTNLEMLCAPSASTTGDEGNASASLLVNA